MTSRLSGSQRRPGLDLDEQAASDNIAVATNVGAPGLIGGAGEATALEALEVRLVA